jgi:hypothetical protein
MKLSRMIAETTIHIMNQICATRVRQPLLQHICMTTCTHWPHERGGQHYSLVVPISQHHSKQREKRFSNARKTLDVVAKQEVGADAKADEEDDEHEKEGADVRDLMVLNVTKSQGGKGKTTYRFEQRFRYAGETFGDGNVFENFEPHLARRE